MPHTNTWEAKGLYRKFTGEISVFEILDSNFKLHEHPDFQKIKYIINDFTEVTGHSIEASHTEVFAKTDEIASYTKGKLKIALLVTQAALIPLAKGYREQMKDKTFECEILQTIEAAREWVGK